MCFENLYTCSKCDFTTRNDDPDCSKCGATYCMMAKTVEEEEEYCCIDCDYSLSPAEFHKGKGRIMFCEGEGIEEGKYRCGVCDIRASADGYWPKPNLPTCQRCEEVVRVGFRLRGGFTIGDRNFTDRMLCRPCLDLMTNRYEIKKQNKMMKKGRFIIIEP